MEDMLGKAAKSGKGKVADLQGLFLLDTMYASSDSAKVIAFLGSSAF
jgi:hypothetical protein